MRLRVSAALREDSSSRHPCTALLLQSRRRPSELVAGQEHLGKREACSVYVVKFCLGRTQREMCLTNFSIHGEDWSCAVHRRRSSDWDAMSVSWWKEGKGLQQSLFVSSKPLGGKSLSFHPKTVETRSALLVSLVPVTALTHHRNPQTQLCDLASWRTHEHP